MTDSGDTISAVGANIAICSENGDEAKSSSTPEEDKVLTVADTVRNVVHVEETVQVVSSEPDNTVIYSSTTTVEAFSEKAVKESGPILSMAKLEDLENFMDTLLDSELDNSTLTSQTTTHDTELSVAQPLTDTQLMGELCKLNEKLVPSNLDCEVNGDGKVKEKSVDAHKHIKHEGDSKTGIEHILFLYSHTELFVLHVVSTSTQASLNVQLPMSWEYWLYACTTMY